MKKTISSININSSARLNIKKIELIYKNNNVSLDFYMFSFCLFLLKIKDLIIIDEDNQIKTANTTFTNFLLSWYNKNRNGFILVNKLFVEFESLDFDISNIENDFLGFIYESLRTENDKSILGAYFTPSQIVSDIDIPVGKTVLDNCAGTGTFILSIIKKEHSPKQITLRDIDELSLNIAKVNFVLFFNQIDELINTEPKNVLAPDEVVEKFDYIMTNPPYGAKLDKTIKKQLLIDYPTLKTTETFSIALYNSISKLSKNGKMSIVLPESFLYVDTHINIRRYLFNLSKNIKIRHFGNAFKGIMSKIIRIDIETNTNNEINIKILNNNIECLISNDILVKNNYRPPYITDLQDIDILDKISKTDSFTLENKCKFGLGIVTGNNDLHLKKHFFKGLEAIFTGKELNAFKFDKPKYYIDFEPQKLQQVAPTNLYRQNKICYSFISNKIITVVDTEHSLVLNSINFFIPDKNIDLKALSTFLNSEVISFIYQTLCKSIKVLRNHIENLPIPKTFFDNINILNNFYEQSEKSIDIKLELNGFIGKLYGLNEKEINYISKKHLKTIYSKTMLL